MNAPQKKRIAEMSEATQQAVAKFGEFACRDAFELLHYRGHVASWIAQYGRIDGVSTEADARAAIEAGREFWIADSAYRAAVVRYDTGN